MGVAQELVKDTYLPHMIKIRQTISSPVLEMPAEETLKQLEREEIASQISPGMTIAVGVGSRGIQNLQLIVKTMIDWLKDKGAQPFIIPTMGSHGGATAKGQLEILKGYGITEQLCGCPVRGSMETVQIGTTEEGHPVFIDRLASEADGIIVIGRIKPHTCFTGSYESGIMKMLTIGLGKQKGAESCHKAGFKHMAHLVPLFGNVIIKNTNILFGLAVIENANEETCLIRTLPTEEIIQEEPELLKYSRHLMPKIPFGKTDVLIVDKIGKNFSGDGMDPNITGTFVTPYASGGIEAQRVVVLDVSEESHGNGVGIGNADVINRRVFEKTDFEVTYPNAITSKVLSCVSIPMMFENDQLAIQCAVKTCTEIDFNHPRIIRISDSLHINEIWVSAAFLPELESDESIEILSEAAPFAFDEYGNLF